MWYKFSHWIHTQPTFFPPFIMFKYVFIIAPTRESGQLWSDFNQQLAWHTEWQCPYAIILKLQTYTESLHASSPLFRQKINQHHIALVNRASSHKRGKRSLRRDGSHCWVFIRNTFSERINRNPVQIECLIRDVFGSIQWRNSFP